MLSKEEIETCKEEARNYIEFMETAGDNAGWTRGLMWYIEQLESREQKLIEKLEEGTIDIDSIEELYIGKVTTEDRLIINKLVQAVKQLNKEIKSIKEKQDGKRKIKENVL